MRTCVLITGNFSTIFCLIAEPMAIISCAVVDNDDDEDDVGGASFSFMIIDGSSTVRASAKVIR